MTTDRRAPLSFAPLAVPSAHEHVLARLRRAIALSEILPGERLPSERELADALAVSRITVREALRVLQAEGLIATRRGRGGGTVLLPDAVATLSAREGPDELTRRITDVQEVRSALEPMAAGLAATRGGPTDVAALRRHQAELRDSVDIDAFRRADSGFHLTIARASGNTLLHRAIEDVRSAMFLMVDATEFTIVHAPNLHAHEAILEAVADGDAEAASRRMAEHIAEASTEITQAVAHRTTGPAL